MLKKTTNIGDGETKKNSTETSLQKLIRLPKEKREMCKRLVKAAKCGDLDEVKECCEKTPELINYSGGYYAPYNALQAACSHDDDRYKSQLFESAIKKIKDSNTDANEKSYIDLLQKVYGLRSWGDTQAIQKMIIRWEVLKGKRSLEEARRDNMEAFVDFILKNFLKIDDKDTISKIKASFTREMTDKAKEIIEVVKYLLDQGADPNITGRETYRKGEDATALLCASDAGNLTIINMLIKSNADVNAIRKKDNNTALHQALRFHHSDVALRLIEAGADVNIECELEHRFVLDKACSNSNLAVINALITKQAKMDDAIVRFIYKFKETEATLVSIENLIRLGGDKAVNQARFGGKTALHTAADKQKNKFASILINSGANVNAEDEKGKSPLDIAIANENIELIQLLYQAGARPTDEKGNYYLKCNSQALDLAVDSEFFRKPDPNGNNLLHIAVALQDYEKIDSLAKEDGIVNIGNNQGNTPLHLAIQQEDIEAATILKAHEADISVANDDGKTPADVILEIEDIETKLSFLELFKPTHQEKYDSILTNYLEQLTGSYWPNLDEKIVKRLVLLGADPNCQNNEGNTALHMAARMNSEGQPICSFLLSKGADVDALNNQGETPLFHGLPMDYYLIGENASFKHFNIFIDWNTNFNVINSSGRSMLQCALAQQHDSPIFKWLCQSGADVNVALPCGKPLLSVQCSEQFGEVHSLFNAGIELDLNWQDKNGNTALHHAAMSGNSSAIDLLILNGADFTIQNKDEKQPIELASRPEVSKRIRKNILTISFINKLRELIEAENWDSAIEYSKELPNNRMGAYTVNSLFYKVIFHSLKKVDAVSISRWSNAKPQLLEVESDKVIELIDVFKTKGLEPSKVTVEDKLSDTPISCVIAEKSAWPIFEHCFRSLDLGIGRVDSQGNGPLNYAQGPIYSELLRGFESLLPAYGALMDEDRARRVALLFEVGVVPGGSTHDKQNPWALVREYYHRANFACFKLMLDYVVKKTNLQIVVHKLKTIYDDAKESPYMKPRSYREKLAYMAEYLKSECDRDLDNSPNCLAHDRDTTKTPLRKKRVKLSGSQDTMFASSEPELTVDAHERKRCPSPL